MYNETASESVACDRDIISNGDGSCGRSYTALDGGTGPRRAAWAPTRCHGGTTRSAWDAGDATTSTWQLRWHHWRWWWWWRHTACSCCCAWSRQQWQLCLHSAHVMKSGFLRSGNVREFSGSQGKSGKTERERVRKKSGNFKIPLTRPIIYALFSQFLSASGGFALRPPPGRGSTPVNTAG